MSLFTEKSEKMTIQDVQEYLQGILEQLEFLCDDIADVKLDDYDRVMIESSLSDALGSLDEIKLRLKNAEYERL
jgi:hypothetical protein